MSLFKKKWFVILAVVIATGVVAFIFINKKAEPKNTTTNTPDTPEMASDLPLQSNPTPTPPAPTFDLETPSSITFIANKQRPLPSDYVPPDLIVPDVTLRLGSAEEQMHTRKTLTADLSKMFTDAKSAGLQLVFGSGYRSYAKQKSFYNGYVASSGRAEADTFSARPGHSEHQTGLAIDFTRSDGSCHLAECFETTSEGKWLSANAHKYGFILRYPKNKQDVTGYKFEPWHFRYLGVDNAQKVYDSGKTVEEFFGLPAAPDYNP